MIKMIDKNNLKISTTLFEFINNEAIPGTDIDVDNFWKKFSDVVHELAPINKKLIEKRENIQKKIDNWHISNKGKEFDKIKYIAFLKSIGYLVDEGNDFNIACQVLKFHLSQVHNLLFQLIMQDMLLMQRMQDGEVYMMHLWY